MNRGNAFQTAQKASPYLGKETAKKQNTQTSRKFRIIIAK